MSSNEPFHPFLADEFFEGEPMTDREKRIAQFYSNDGIRMGRDQGLRIFDEYQARLHSNLGESIIKQIEELMKKSDEA